MDVGGLLATVSEAGGSDLHLTVGLPPVMRLHGRLVPLDAPALTPEMTRDLTFSVMTPEQRQQLERRCECDFAYSVAGARFRVNVYYQRGSVGAAFRVIPERIRDYEDLGLPGQVLHEWARKPRGLVLVTGATGSGKSTTLAAMIDDMNRSLSLHIMTIEDPIEYVHVHDRAMVNQREVGADTESFSSALKYVLRQDPDVILIGEMRDQETMQAALTAAETGHLVLATLHTQDAVQTVDRIIGSFQPHFQPQVRIQLAASLQGIISQQLLPTIDGRSRVVAVEVLVPTSGVRNMIREGKTHQITTAIQTGHQYSMTSMDESLADLYRRGLVTLDAALSRAVDQTVLRSLLDKPKPGA